MSSLEVKVPDIGVEGEVEVIEVCVAKGDEIEAEAPVIVVESDKATVEVPSPESGKVKRVSVAVGDKVVQGDLILEMDAVATGNGDTSSTETEQDNEPAEPSRASVPEPVKEASSGGSLERDLIVPDLGGTNDVEVIELLVEAGDEIGQDDPLLVLESDKATMEVPASDAGTVLELTVRVGDTVSSGDVIGKVRVSEESSAKREQAQSDSRDKPEKEDESAKHSRDRDSSVESSDDDASQTRASSSTRPEPEDVDSSQLSKPDVHAGPAVRKFARELGVELGRVDATGPKGRILKEDLDDYIKTQVQKAQNGEVGVANQASAAQLPDFREFGQIEVVAMSKMHKVTAQNMQQSWSSIPHVTQFEEADITDLEAFRKGHRQRAEEKGVKLTPLPFLLKACAYALEALPQFNVSLDMVNQQIIQKHYIHIGVAVDTPNGLMVPVIRDVNEKSLWRLADECQTLAGKARDRKLSPNDMKGGCFTISSLGGIGGTAFTPIVNSPEVAILGVSKSRYQPVFNGKDFDPRLMLPLSLSYDHRAVNGADAARFASLVATVLGDIRELLL